MSVHTAIHGTGNYEVVCLLSTLKDYIWFREDDVDKIFNLTLKLDNSKLFRDVVDIPEVNYPEYINCRFVSMDDVLDVIIQKCPSYELAYVGVVWVKTVLLPSLGLKNEQQIVENFNEALDRRAEYDTADEVTPKGGYIVVARCSGGAKDLYKIGSTVSVDAKIARWNQGSFDEFALYKTINVPSDSRRRAFERKFRDKLAQYMVKRQFYKFTDTATLDALVEAYTAETIDVLDQLRGIVRNLSDRERARLEYNSRDSNIQVINTGVISDHRIHISGVDRDSNRIVILNH